MKKQILLLLFLVPIHLFSQQYVTPVDGIYEVAWMTINKTKIDIPLMVIGIEEESSSVVVMIDTNRNRSLDDEDEKYYQGTWNSEGFISFIYEEVEHYLWCEITGGQRNYYWLTKMPNKEVLCEIYYKAQWSW